MVFTLFLVVIIRLPHVKMYIIFLKRTEDVECFRLNLFWIYIVQILSC